MHKFVKYVGHYANLGSLREVFKIFFLEHGSDDLPRDDEECKKIIKKAIDVYFHQKKK